MKTIGNAFRVAALCLGVFCAAGAAPNKELKMKETALFKADFEKKTILGVQESVKDYMKVQFVSLTTDQPLYWPNEDVFLKTLMPLTPGAKFRLTLQKKGASSKDLGLFSVNDAGIAVQTILSGKERKIEAGEYTATIKAVDGDATSYTSFTVVEGSLGAVSFAHEFKQLTSAAQLEKEKGAWFFGNAAGVGKRWGNGLNVKNEVRVLNQPFNGEAKIKSRCFLSGCNGVEAGTQQTVAIKDGKLELVLEVGGHSGPFGIEVITEKGSVEYVFGRSGHVERQTIPVSGGMKSRYIATLAPYEKTIPVPGRDIFVVKEGEDGSAVFDIASPIIAAGGNAVITALKDIENPRVFVLTPAKGGAYASKEIKTSSMKNGAVLPVPCSAPYSLIAIAGFSDGKYREAWAVCFPASSIDAEIQCAGNGLPLKQFSLTVKTFERGSRKALPAYGILEVFDNRVQSKSSKEPLASAVGDGARSLGNYLSSWRDYTGVAEEDEVQAKDEPMQRKEMKKMSAPRAAAGVMMDMSVAPSVAPAPKPASSSANEPQVTADLPPDQETIREGEKKVVYCAVVKTGADGSVVVPVTLPPQTGRCTMRFTAISGFDYAEAVKDVDVAKDNYLEVSMPTLIMPDADIEARVTAVIYAEGAQLTVSRNGEKASVYKLKKGAQELAVPLSGKKTGVMLFSLVDASGKTLDKREMTTRNIASFPITFSDIMISDGKPMTIAGGTVTAYAHPGKLLENMAMNMTTTMYSWFGHAEALSASCAIRAVLISAIDGNIIDGNGMRDTLKSDLVKTVKDLRTAFYDDASHLVRPYPGVDVNERFSIWTVNNLSAMLTHLDGNRAGEFADTIARAKEIIDGVRGELKKRQVTEAGLFDIARGVQTIPVEVDGKVVYTAITDKAAVDWFVAKALPKFALDKAKDDAAVNANFISLYDTYRFLRSFERTGATYYLLLNAKGMYTRGDAKYPELFNRIAKNILLTQEPGLIQGPALLGGVYSSSGTVAQFLDLMLAMAKDKKVVQTPEITVTKAGKKDRVKITRGFTAIGGEGGITVEAPQYVTLRVDTQKEVNMMSYVQNKPFLKANVERTSLKTGDEVTVSVELNADMDPAEYYAVIAVPTTLSIRQTEDLLSDYKGQLLYGQRASGGQKIQMLTAPFRGSRTMNLICTASVVGESEGYVFVRHVSNPAKCATVKIHKVTVR
ncbi:MAG: hypothetical protein HZC28_06480 [Spirochaetes bacterium]|nr:hypothetical protein [Spirochaetota bacterium]